MRSSRGCAAVVLGCAAAACGLSPSALVSPPASVRNLYFAVRHGQSTANVENIISSCPQRGSREHELTPLGREQAREAGKALWAELERSATPLDRVALYSSNFTRARETKELAAFELQRRWQRTHGRFEAPPLRIGMLEALRERDFGTLDALNTGAYDVVWPRDKADPFIAEDGVEPVAQVCQRLSSMVEFLEERHDGDAIALVAHADVIQIFQCWFANHDVRDFSSYRFKNGEVRRCHLNDPDSLPEPVPMVSQAGVAA